MAIYFMEIVFKIKITYIKLYKMEEEDFALDIIISILKKN